MSNLFCHSRVAPLVALSLSLAACPSSSSQVAPTPAPAPDATPKPDARAPAPIVPMLCLDASGGGFPPGLALEGTVFRYGDYNDGVGAFDVVKGAFVMPPPRPPEPPAPDDGNGDAARPAPPYVIASADDDRVVEACSSETSCSILKPGAPFSAAALDPVAGVVYLALEPAGRPRELARYDFVSGKRMAAAKTRAGWRIETLTLKASSVLDAFMLMDGDSPPTDHQLIDSATLKPIADTSPYDAGRFAFVVRDPATWKITRRVDLWPLHRDDELRSSWWAAPYFGPQGTDSLEQQLPSGEWLVTAEGDATGTIAVVDPEKQRIVRWYRLPICGAPVGEPVQCLPAAVTLAQPRVAWDVFEACASEQECYAFDLAAGRLARRERTISTEPNHEGFGMSVTLDYENVPACDDKPLRVGGTLSGFAYARDTVSAYALTAGSASKPAALTRFATDACKPQASVVVGSKAHPCASIEALGEQVLVRTDDCKGAPGGAFIVDGCSLKRVSAVGPEHDFSIGHGRTLAALLFGDVAAIATSEGQTLVFQHLATGAVVGTMTLPAPASGAAASIDAVWSSPVGDAIVQRGRAFTRVSVDGRVLATTTLPTCP